MPYEITSTPWETAKIFKDLHRAEDFAARQRILLTAPLPEGCSATLKTPRSETLDQDRLNLPKDLAYSIDRVWGRVISLREEKVNSANTLIPGCADVLLRIPFWGGYKSAYRSVFVRTSAYLSNFAPRTPDHMDWTIARGDIVSGIVMRLTIPPYDTSLLKER